MALGKSDSVVGTPRGSPRWCRGGLHCQWPVMRNSLFGTATRRWNGGTMMPRSVHRLIRPLVVALAAVLVGPVLTVNPASAAVLFTCNGIDGGPFPLSPGLSHTQTAQSAFQNDVTLGFSLPCDNGEKGFFRIGRNFTGLTDVT